MGRKREVIPYPSPPPTLILGLAQQLPKGRTWTRKQADEWLELARAVFKVVYEFEDAPTTVSQKQEPLQLASQKPATAAHQSH